MRSMTQEVVLFDDGPVLDLVLFSGCVYDEDAVAECVDLNVAMLVPLRASVPEIKCELPGKTPVSSARSRSRRCSTWRSVS